MLGFNDININAEASQYLPICIQWLVYSIQVMVYLWSLRKMIEGVFSDSGHLKLLGRLVV